MEKPLGWGKIGLIDDKAVIKDPGTEKMSATRYKLRQIYSVYL